MVLAYESLNKEEIQLVHGIEKPLHKNPLIRLFLLDRAQLQWLLNKGCTEGQTLRACMCEMSISFPHTCMRVWLDPEFWVGIHFPSEGTAFSIIFLFPTLQFLTLSSYVICTYSFVFIVLKIFMMMCLGMAIFKLIVLNSWGVL